MKAIYFCMRWRSFCPNRQWNKKANIESLGYRRVHTLVHSHNLPSYKLCRYIRSCARGRKKPCASMQSKFRHVPQLCSSRRIAHARLARLSVDGPSSGRSSPDCLGPWRSVCDGSRRRRPRALAAHDHVFRDRQQQVGRQAQDQEPRPLEAELSHPLRRQQGAGPSLQPARDECVDFARPP